MDNHIQVHLKKCEYVEKKNIVTYLKKENGHIFYIH